MAKDKKSTMGSDLRGYVQRKIAEIDEPRYEEYRGRLQNKADGETPRFPPRSLKNDAKVMGLGVLGAYGEGPATVIDGGINALNAAGDVASKAKTEVGSRLRRGVPAAVEAVGSAGNAAIQKTADAAKRLRNSVFGKDAKTAASKDTEKKAKGGAIKSSASRRGDGIAQRGKTKGRFI